MCWIDWLISGYYLTHHWVLEPPSHLSHRPPRWQSHRCHPHQPTNLQVPESPGARAIDPPTLPTHQTTGATDHHQGVWLTNPPNHRLTRATIHQSYRVMGHRFATCHRATLPPSHRLIRPLIQRATLTITTIGTIQY